MRTLIIVIVVCAVTLAATTLWPERYHSPCVVSWDENADAAVPSTFCIMTERAARREKQDGSFDPR